VTTDRPGAVRRFWQGCQRGRLAFRRWRRGRPFWAGLFLLLGGVQLFLSTQLSLPDLEISFGPQGFLAILLPVVLLLCGILVWATPQHRLFYSVIGMLTAVYSLLGLNLGGWFIGMLVGIVGGALGIAWTPVTPKPPTTEEPPPPEEEPPPYVDGEDERPTADLTGPLVDEPPGTDQTAPVRAPRQDPRTYVMAALPLLLTAALAGPSPVTQICLPLLCPDPPAETPSPSPTPTPTPTPSPDPDPGPDPTPSPGPTDPGEEPTEPPPDPDESELPTCDPPSDHPLVAAQPALMTADRLDQESFRFECVTELPTADGPIEVLRFSFSRTVASNFSLTTTGEGQPARVTADPLTLAGDVTFYTNRFIGNLFGAVPLELTPDSPVTDLLELVDLPPLPVFFTDVNLNLVFTHGAELTAAGFVLSLP
jgi:Family of unknown function (DUF6114)